MARIRTIKPEFWGDEKLAPLPALARLVFLGLISMADDAGRLLDNVKSIDGFIFPESDETSRDSLDILASTSRILRYTSESGQKLIQIANWLRHQKVDRPSKYVLPAPEEVSRKTRDTLAKDSRSDLGPTTNDQRPPTVEPDRAAPPPQRDTSATERLSGAAQQSYDEAMSDLYRLLVPFNGARSELDTFMAGLPADAKRLVWARSLKASVEPITGGRRIPAGALAAALADFNLADRARYPYTGACFRAFCDRAESEMNRPKPIAGISTAGDVLDQWARAHDARAKAHSNA